MRRCTASCRRRRKGKEDKNNVQRNADKTRAMELLRSLAAKYYPDEQTVDEEIQKSGKAAQVFEVEIEHLSGKEVQER